MKGITKRLWAFLMALVLLVGLLPVVQFTATAATVTYVTDDTTGYIYNWGTREVAATYLSQNAEDFYTNNSTSYDALASLSGSALYSTLQTLMTDNHTWINDYDDVKDLCQYTDCQGSALLDDSISSFYMGSSVGPTWDGTWNREHTWPQSKGLDVSDEDDIMMLRPADSSANSARGNKAYGESTGFYDPNSESNGAYDLRGDVARIVLYVYVRWGNTNLFGAEGVIESQDLLLQWMSEDPVDTWELGRNDSVESMTGTRNVFVDYPELAFALFEEEIPAMVTPSGEAASVDYTITAAANDPSMGTVAVYGNVITAFPAAGHYAESYTVTSGTATVAQNGNAFTVNATADCTVQINFAVLDTVTVSFCQNGETISSEDRSLEGFKLPAYTGEVAEGYCFAGWSQTPVFGTQNMPALYQPEELFTPTADTTFYAVYAYLDESEQGVWTLVTDDAQLYAGNQVVIAAKDYAVVAGAIPSGKVYMDQVSAFFLENWIPELPAEAQILTLGGHEGAWTVSNADGALLGANTNKDLKWDAGTTTWTISIADGVLTMGDVDGACGTMQYNLSAARFKVYAPGQKAAQLYIYDTDAGALHYTNTIAAPCEHTDTVTVPEQAPTDAEIGWTAGVYCYDCGKYISGHEKITPAGTSCTVNFVVPSGVDAISNTLCDANGITLPEADAPDGYTFVGWSETPVNNDTAKPDILVAGSTYKTYTGNSKALYALYTYSIVDNKTIYTLATDVSQLKTNQQVIIAAVGYDYAMSTTQNNNNRGQTDIVKNDDGTLADPSSDVAVLTLQEGSVSGTYAFYTGDDGYLYAAGASSSNYLRTSTTLNANASFSISIAADGTCSILASGTGTRKDLRYNNSNKIFSCYAEGGQKAVCLYLGSTTTGDVTYYTTVIGDDCAHEVTDFSSAVAATCTASGWTGELLCDDCGEFLAKSQSIPATGHASAAFVPAREGSCTEVGCEAHYACSACDTCYLEKAADAEVYTLPTAFSHDYSEDPLVCGSCGHARATVKLTTVSLRPSAAGIYYSGELTWDENDADIISCGIAVSLENPEPVADDTCLYTEGSVSALVTNIMKGTDATQNALNARTSIYARAYVQLTDGYVYSDTVQVSLRQMVQEIDSRLLSNNSLTETQMDALADMYRSFADVMENWNIPNLKAYAEEN